MRYDHFLQIIKAAGEKDARRVAELYVDSSDEGVMKGFMTPPGMPEVRAYWIWYIAEEIKPYLRPRGRPNRTGSDVVATAAYYAARYYDQMLSGGARKYGLLEKAIRQSQERMRAEGRAVPDYESIKNWLYRPEPKPLRDLGKRLEVDEARLLER